MQAEEDDANSVNDEEFMDSVVEGAMMQPIATRRSRRSTTVSTGRNGHTVDWRVERRSSRLEKHGEPPVKRARTDSSGASVDLHAIAVHEPHKPQQSSAGAATVRPNEVIVEQVAGKKKSKFWYYAVETLPGSTPSASGALLVNGNGTMPAATAPSSNGNGTYNMNGLRDTCDMDGSQSNVSESVLGSVDGNHHHNMLANSTASVMH